MCRLQLPAARGRQRSLGVALLLVAALVSPQAAAGGCVVRLDVAPGPLAFRGASAASLMPGSFPVTVAEPGAGQAAPDIGLAGPMFLALPGDGACPTTAKAWRAALAARGSRLASSPGPYNFKPLAVFPPVLPLEVMGIPLNISGLGINLTLSGGRASPAGPGGLFPLSVDARVAQGYVYSNTPLTGGPQLQPFSSSEPSAGVAKGVSVSLAPAAGAGGPARLNVTLPELALVFVSRTSGVVGGKAWNGTMSFSLTGRVTLTGLVGCPHDCGTWGRCVALNGSAEGFGCECECGWAIDPTTQSCAAPAGSCPLYGSETGAGVVRLADGGGANASGGAGAGAGCTQGETVAATGGTCPNHYGFDVFTKTCTRCQDDWSGPGCKLCTTDRACQAKLSKSSAICNTGMLWNERSQAKHYSCQLSDPMMARLIGPVLPLSCSAASSSSKPGSNSALAVSDASLLSSTSTCTIAMRLVGMPQGTSAQCTATGCQFSAGSPSFECRGVACDCPSGCPPSYLKTFRDVHGAVTLDCDTTGQSCSIVIGSLDMKIKASCDASECLDSAGPKLLTSAQARHGGPPIAPPVVAALPLLALLLAGCACTASLLRYKAYLCRSACAKARAGAGAARPLGEGVEDGLVRPRPMAASPRDARSSGSGDGSSSTGSGDARAIVTGPAAPASRVSPRSASPRQSPRFSPRNSPRYNSARNAGYAAQQQQQAALSASRSLSPPKASHFLVRGGGAAAQRQQQQPERLPQARQQEQELVQAKQQEQEQELLAQAAKQHEEELLAQLQQQAHAQVQELLAKARQEAQAQAQEEQERLVQAQLQAQEQEQRAQAIAQELVQASQQAPEQEQAAREQRSSCGAGSTMPEACHSGVSCTADAPQLPLPPPGLPPALRLGGVPQQPSPQQQQLPLATLQLRPGGGTTSTNCTSNGLGLIHELAFFEVTADVRERAGWRQLASAAIARRGSTQGGGPAAAPVAAPAPGWPVPLGDVEQGAAASKDSGRLLGDASLPSLGSSRVNALLHRERTTDGSDDASTARTDITQQQQQPPAQLAPAPQQRAQPAQPARRGSRWRPVLRGVSGCVGSGELLGVMGPSGGGKSTLLMKLCGGLGGGRGGEWRSSGVVCLDGVAAPPSLLTAVTALVPQDDSLMRSLTVEECVRYSAALRLDPALPPAAVAARVEGVLRALGLEKIRRSVVLSGTGASSVSGGERRRVAIAMELVIDPQILVLDEPLSGLDSYTALQLMRSLQSVAASGRVVALSLHQPSPALFGALDTAMLLADGLMVYSGPPAAAADALRGLGCPVPPGITVAEHLLHVVSDPTTLRLVLAATVAAQSEARRKSQALLGDGALAPQQQALLSGQLAVHAASQRAPAHLSAAAAATAASLTAGSAAAAGKDGGAPVLGAASSPLSPKASWLQRLTGFGSGAPPQQQQQQQQQGWGAQAQAPVLAQQATQPLSPKPSWYHRISAPRPLKGGQQQQRSQLAQPLPPGAAAGGSKAARLALGLPRQQRPFARQVGVLFWRGSLDMLRNPLLCLFHSLGGAALGLLVGVIFFSVKNDTSGAQNRVGAIFFALCLLAFTSVTSVDLVQAEASAAGREMQRRYYSPLAYAVTKLVLDGLLLRALPALLFGLPFYFLMGLNTAPLTVLVFLLVQVAFSATVGALALGFAAALDSPGKTILVMNLVLLLGVLFGGFLANKASIPAWLRWVSWLSVFRYAWEALVINELSGLDLFLSAPGVSLSLPVRGDVFLQIIGVDPSLFLVDIAVLAGMYAAACAFVLAVLAWRNRVRSS